MQKLSKPNQTRVEAPAGRTEDSTGEGRANVSERVKVVRITRPRQPARWHVSHVDRREPEVDQSS